MEELKKEKNHINMIKASRKRRILAFLIDQFVVTFLIVSIIFIFLKDDFLKESPTAEFMPAFIFIMIIGFLIYFMKDSYKGTSIGKFIVGITVREQENPTKIPLFHKLFIRNLFLIIWPIEFIILISSKQKQRLGDKVSKTVVLRSSFIEAKSSRIIAFVGIVVIFVFSIFILSINSMKSSDAYIAAIEEIEKNEVLISEVGNIKKYGMIPTGSVKMTNGEGQAEFEIKVCGEIKEISVFVYLEKVRLGDWQVLELQKEDGTIYKSLSI